MAKDVEYRDPSPNNFPDDYDRTKVDQRILLRSDSVFHRTKGVDVREGVGQEGEIAGVIAQEAKEEAQDAKEIAQQNKKELDAGVGALTKDSEVVIAREGKDTLVENMKDKATKDDLSSTNATITNIKDVDVGIDGGVQEPFKSELDKYKLLLDQDDKTARVGFLTDIHFQRNIINPPDGYGQATDRGLQHIQHMGYLKDKLDLVVFNGDNVHGVELKHNTYRRNKQVAATARASFGNVPIIFTMGNHDDNNIAHLGKNKAGNTLSMDELKDAYGISADYGYQDIAGKNLRVIVLDAFENPERYDGNGLSKYTRAYNSIFSQKQLNWLANDALQTTSHVLITMHCPPLGFFNNKPYDKYQDINHDLLLNILKAFINGQKYTGSGTNADYPADVTADFSAQGGGTLIGIATGHEHRDGGVQVTDGIRVINRLCNVADNRGLDKLTEECFDVIEVNTSKKHVKFNRFGVGSSLEFDY